MTSRYLQVYLGIFVLFFEEYVLWVFLLGLFFSTWELFIIRGPPEALCRVCDTFCVGHSLCKCLHRLNVLVFGSSPISLPPAERWQWSLVSQMSSDPKRLLWACFLHSLFIWLFPFLIILTTEPPLRSSFSFHLIHFNIRLSTAPLSL